MYLDHILVFSQNHTEHTHHVQQVLQWLLENCLFIKVEKCLTRLEPLTRLTSTPFVWTPEAEAAFNKLKKLFTSAYMLI